MDIEVSAAFATLLNDITQDWRVDFDDLNQVSYDLNIEKSLIILHSYGLKPEQAMASPYFRPQILLALAEALRMARHVEWLEGILSRHHPETIILIGRICVADTMVQKIHFAHQMKIHHGDGGLWKHVLCGECGDMAQAYLRALEGCMGHGMAESSAVKKAMAVAFNLWFSDPDKVKVCDHDTLNLIDGMMVDQTRFQGQRLGKNAITCLTLIPGESSTYIDAYLQDDILKNPYYVAINDPINQSHFMQIVTDMNSYRVGGIVFRDPALAARFALCGDPV